MALRGPSGAGKSGLALRAFREGWRLVADDRTLVWNSGGVLYGRAPATIADLVEARGLGVVRANALRWAPVKFVVDLTPEEAVERMPEPATVDLCGVRTPLFALCAHDSAALAKLALAMDTVFPCAATSLGLVR